MKRLAVGALALALVSCAPAASPVKGPSTPSAAAAAAAAACVAKGATTDRYGTFEPVQTWLTREPTRPTPGLGYDPTVAHIKPGTVVQWYWPLSMGSLRVSVTADDGSFDSCPRGAGKTFAVKFPRPGTFFYHDTVNQQTAAVVVSP